MGAILRVLLRPFVNFFDKLFGSNFSYELGNIIVCFVVGVIIFSILAYFWQFLRESFCVMGSLVSLISGAIIFYFSFQMLVTVITPNVPAVLLPFFVISAIFIVIIGSCLSGAFFIKTKLKFLDLLRDVQ